MVHTFSVDLAPLLHENTILKQQVESLQKENHDLLTRLANTKEIEKTLSKKYDTLQLDYNALQDQNKLLAKQVEDLELENKLLKKEVEDLKTRVSGLEARKEDADGVDVCYAMNALEKWICLNIVGSKNKVKQGLYTLHLLGARPEYAKEIPNRVSPEALQLLQYYKDNGDYIAHTSKFTATELESALLENKDEKIDDQTLATIKRPSVNSCSAWYLTVTRTTSHLDMIPSTNLQRYGKSEDRRNSDCVMEFVGNTTCKAFYTYIFFIETDEASRSVNVDAIVVP